MDVIFGAGGFAREVEMLAFEIREAGLGDFDPQAFVTRDADPLCGLTLAGLPVCSETVFFERATDAVRATIAIGDPRLRSRLAASIRARLPRLEFVVLTHPDATYDRRPGRVRFGEGVLCLKGMVGTTDFELGAFTHMSVHSVIGHDSRIGRCVTLSPGVHISGCVTIGDEVFVGTNAAVLEGLEIVAGSVIGSGAVVTRSLTEPGTYVGMPARKKQA